MPPFGLRFLLWKGEVHLKATLLAQAATEGVDAGGLLAGGACGIVGLLIGIVAVIGWIWALVHAIRNPALNSTERLIWVLVIVFASLLGAAAYFIVAGAKNRGGQV